MYLASVSSNGGSASDDGILSVDISGTPATSAVYYVQKYTDGGVAKFRWRLSSSESYTTGTTNTITANTPLYLDTAGTKVAGFTYSLIQYLLLIILHLYLKCLVDLLLTVIYT